MKVEKQTILALLFICFIAHGNCHKKPTAPKTGTLTGTVYLEGEQDHSGITVALYKLAELDTTILRYNREYPLIFSRDTCMFSARFFYYHKIRLDLGHFSVYGLYFKGIHMFRKKILITNYFFHLFRC